MNHLPSAPSADAHFRRIDEPRPPAKMRFAEHGHAHMPGFTLVEILACMVIFAIGFAAVAAILPTGFWMQQEVEDNADATIVANNALDVMKAKGLHSLTYLYGKNGRAMDLDDVGFLGSKIPGALKKAAMGTAPSYAPSAVYTPSWNPTYSYVQGAGTGWHSRLCNWDMEGLGFCWRLKPNTPLHRYANLTYCTGLNAFSPVEKFSGMATLAPYLNTNKNGYLWGGGSGDVGSSTRFINTYSSGTHLNDQGDLTDLSWGKIHCFKNRPVPGFTPGYPSVLDLSYPSSTLDLKSRTYVASVLCWNKSVQYESGDKAAQSSAPGKQDWAVAAMVMRMRSGDEWPELGNVDPDNPLNAPAPAPQPPAGYLFANDTLNMRSVGKPPASFGATWYRWFMASYPNHNTTASSFTAPPTGGDPANADAGLRVGGLGWASQNSPTSGTDPVGRSWFNGKGVKKAYYGPLPLSVVGQPIRDPASVGADYQGYVVPSLIRPYALVYDYNQDLILLHYPSVYRKNYSGGDARTKDFFDRYPANSPSASSSNNWVDRKLKVGDSFLGSPGGYAFQVKEIVDPIAAGLAAPGAMDWSDGTYQVVRVIPSLKGTNYTPNKPCILAETVNTEKTDPPLYQAVVGTPPLAGGNNPCRALVSLPAANGVVFRDNMAD